MIIQIGFSERDREIDQTVSLSSLCAFMQRTMNHRCLSLPLRVVGVHHGRDPISMTRNTKIGALYQLAIISHSASTWLNLP